MYPIAFGLFMLLALKLFVDGIGMKLGRAESRVPVVGFFIALVALGASHLWSTSEWPPAIALAACVSVAVYIAARAWKLKTMRSARHGVQP